MDVKLTLFFTHCGLNINWSFLHSWTPPETDSSTVVKITDGKDEAFRLKRPTIPLANPITPPLPTSTTKKKTLLQEETPTP